MGKLKSIEELSAMWSEDAKIDEFQLDKEALKIPILHAKWLDLLRQYKFLVKIYDDNYRKLRQMKWRYYAGKMDKDELKELGWPPFQHTVLKEDMMVWLEGDEKLIELGQKKFYNAEIVEFITAIMKELKDRYWGIRAAIDFQRLQSGA